MKQIKITPQKARVVGNVLPSFDTMEDPPQYEDFHVSHQLLQTTTYQNITKNVLRLSPKGETLYMNITSETLSVHPGEALTVTCNVYYKSGNNEVSLEGQTVYIYDNEIMMGYQVTDENGNVSMEFVSESEGKHSITFRTLYSNGYDPVSETVDIIVYKSVKLTLKPSSISIGHDEITTLSGVLSTDSGVGLPGKSIVLMEGANRTLATVVTDVDGKYSYKYLESKNRGTPTVITVTSPINFVQNTTSEIVGYLKTSDGTPIQDHTVRLYRGYNAWERSSAITDSTGKFTLRYKPTDTTGYMYYIVFCSTVDDTTNNEYHTYEPSFYDLGTITASKSPMLKITNTVLTTGINEALVLNIEIKDTENLNTTFNNEKVLIQYSTNKTNWNDIQTVTIKNNKTTGTFKQGAGGKYYVRLVYNGNSEYVGRISEPVTVTVTRQPITLSTSLYNNALNHMLDTYPITTTVKDTEGNPLSGEIIKYYLDSETSSNLMGTATTNADGVAVLKWASGANDAGTHNVITKHVESPAYEAKTVTNSLKVVKRTRQFTALSGDSVSVGNEYNLNGELTYLTHYTNYLLKCDKHWITIDTEGLTEQPLLLDDFIQSYLISSSVTDNVSPSVVNDGISVGQKGTTYYKYPIVISDDLNVTYEFTLKLDTGAYDGRLGLLRLDDNGNMLGEYDYWLPKSTYGETPTIRIHIVGNVLTITHVDTGTLIRERELAVNTASNKYYIGFVSSTDQKVIIQSMKNDLQPLVKYPIRTLDNWHHNTYPGIDETSQTVQEAYVIGTLRQYDKNKHPFLLDEFVSSHTSNFQEEMSINSDGSLYIGVGTNIRLKNVGTGLDEYFIGDFKIECAIEETGSHYMINLVTPSNESGSIQLNKYTNGSNGIQERGTAGTVTKSTGLSAHPVTTTAHPRNKLIIQRLNGVVSISYTDTNGTDYSYTAEQNLGNNRCNLTFYGYADGTLNIHNLKVTSLDTNTQDIEEAYVGNNGYVFEGCRKGFVLKRAIDFSVDKHIRVETYQKEVWMRVGFATMNGDVINTNSYQYTFVNNIGLGNSDLSNFSVFKYDFKVQPDGTVKAYINGTYTRTFTFNENETPYLLIYNSNVNHLAYVKDVIIRQEQIRIQTSNGQWNTNITPAMLGEYLFKFTVETMDIYYGLHRDKKVYSINKEFPYFRMEPMIVTENAPQEFTAEVPYDAGNEFILKLYDPDDNETIIDTLFQDGTGLISTMLSFNYPKGYYSYSLSYVGDEKYASVESVKQTIEIRDHFDILTDQNVGNTITAPTKSVLNLTGTVKGTIGENYTGSMSIKINDVQLPSITVNEGSYSKAINLYDDTLQLEPGNHTLTLSCSDEYFTTTRSFTLVLITKNTNIVGSNTGVVKGDASNPKWQCQLPKDFTGTIYVYSVDQSGNYITGKPGTSIITSTNNITASNLHIDNIQDDTDRVNVWWTGRWDSNNTTTVNNIKNNVGAHYIKYVLINDTNYNNAESLATFYTRQQAVITVDTNIRQFEEEDTQVNIRAYDTLGQALNGNLTVNIDSDTATVKITNGIGSYKIPSTKRKYTRENHITDAYFKYEYSDEIISNLNTSVTCRTYNIKSRFYGIFMNATQSTTFDDNQYYKVSAMGVTDLYVRANQETGTYTPFQGLEKVLQYLNTNNRRNEFRIHVMFNCVSSGGGTWYIENNKVSASRIQDLKAHISQILQYDIDGICFDYIRRGSATPDSSYEPDISNLVTELSNYVKDNTQNKTIMISACMVPEYLSAQGNYGQNYQVFEEKCDFIIPMVYLYDYSSINETTPSSSNGYKWQQQVINGIYNIGQTNKVVPSITTYKGDANVSSLINKEDMLYQIRGMWNYGAPDNKIQQSAILFRAGLLSDDAITWQQLTDPTDNDIKIEIAPTFTKKTLNKATEKLQITWRNKWGGEVGNIGTGIIKINGVTQKNSDGTNYAVPVTNGQNITLDIDLSKFKTGQNTVEIVYSGSKTYHTLGNRWNDTITLQ